MRSRTGAAPSQAVPTNTAGMASRTDSPISYCAGAIRHLDLAERRHATLTIFSYVSDVTTKFKPLEHLKSFAMSLCTKLRLFMRSVLKN
ncbi:hypothetical protein XFF6991_180360 [Xanthomonas phaseoli pv. phaseoli]|uniref:Uncharacterized protein n=1 Tax=Xanthomonas campestris pv. phaseoli TaxID=317013 RepID=A0A7Z7NFQ4_XANCH|nr:hypothetical protein XFF6991_180360 [Xanthomonas phaseoli pv. phaseoli]